MYAPEGEYAFDKGLTARLAPFRAPAPRGFAKWRPRQMLGLTIMLCVIGWLLLHTHNRFLNPETFHVTLILGTLGIWRLSWWFTHAVRAELYKRRRWPGMRHVAQEVWDSG